MSERRKEIWFALIILACLPVAAGVGIFMYISVTSTPIHPKPEDVTSVMDSAPLPKWADAVARSRQIVRAEVTTQDLPGLSVAVAVGQEIVWAEGFGWADLRKKVPVTPGSRFRIGHVSKALTSAGVGVLVENGRLRLDEEIQTYVPAFPRKQWPVTLRQLMGHVAGVHHYRDTEWGDKPAVHCERASEGLKSFANDPLLFEPETQYRYSTYGWVLVSAAVEAVANEPFSTFMQTHVFTPLGMAGTTSDSPKEPIPDRVTSYYRGNFGNELTTDVDYSCFAGAGAFLSTPSDLVRFGMGRLRQGFGAQGRIREGFGAPGRLRQGFGAQGQFLKPETVSMLQSPQQLTSGKSTDYGLGWMLDTVDLAGERTRLVSHASRTIEGASTSFLTFPDRGIVVAVTANMSFADMRSVALKIADAFAEQARRSGAKNE